MIISKKQGLLTLILAVCSFGLQSSEPERKMRAADEPTSYFARARRWFTRQQPTGTLRGEIVKATGLSEDITNLIGQYAEEYQPYEEIAVFTGLNKLGRKQLGFSEDGSMLTIVGYIDNANVEVVVYNIVDKKEVKRFIIAATPHKEPLLSGNGRFVINSIDYSSEIFDALTGKKIQEIRNLARKPGKGKEYINYEPAKLNYDGTILALVPYSLAKSEVMLLNVRDQQPLVLKNTSMDGYRKDFLQFSRDGKAVACESGGNILVFDSTTGILKQMIPEWPDYMFTVNKDGSRIAFGKDSNIIVIDTYTGVQSKIAQQQYFFTQTGSIIPSQAWIYDFGFTDTDDLLYTIPVILDEKRQFLHIRNIQNNMLQETIPLDSSKVAVLFSNDDRFLALSYEHSLKILKRSTTSEVAQEDLERKREQAKEAEMKKDEERVERERREAEMARLKPSGLTSAALQHIARTPSLPIEQTQQQILPQPQAASEPVVEEVD